MKHWLRCHQTPTAKALYETDAELYRVFTAHDGNTTTLSQNVSPHFQPEKSCTLSLLCGLRHCIRCGILCGRVFRWMRTSFESSDHMYLLLPSWIRSPRPTFRRDILQERLQLKAYQSAGAASNMTHQRGMTEISWMIWFRFCRTSNGCIGPIKPASKAEFAKSIRVAAVGQHLSCLCLSAKHAPTASQTLGPLINDNACFASLDATGTPQARHNLDNDFPEVNVMAKRRRWISKTRLRSEVEPTTASLDLWHCA